MDEAIRKGRRALQTALSVPLSDPFAAAWVRGSARHGGPYRPDAVLAAWQAFHPGSPAGDTRYRWPLSHQRIPIPPFAGAPTTWRPWRASDDRLEADPRVFEQRLSLPVALTECGEFLCEVAADEASENQAAAKALLDEVDPILRRDFSGFIQTQQEWTDTFALWCLARQPRLFERLQPFALAIATCYVALVSRADGVLKGLRYPYHKVPLVSTSAHLSAALLALGQEPALASSLASWVAGEQRSTGGWGDGQDPEDVLTTLVAADLLARIDPTFSPDAAADFLLSRQNDRGYWAAYGPEAPWLTAEVLDLLLASRRPFAERFRWPHLPRATLDLKTGLPSYAWFTQIAELFGALPGLAQARTEMAFIDLAGFRAFNNRFGQDRGDEVLRLFAQQLRGLPSASPLRDGGDEFLVVGTPTASHLGEAFQRLRQEWPTKFSTHFGLDVPPVAPRVLVGRTAGRHVRATREVLGKAITSLKDRAPTPEPEGVLHDLGWLDG